VRGGPTIAPTEQPRTTTSAKELCKGNEETAGNEEEAGDEEQRVAA
jgi:hypothetical protein